MANPYNITVVTPPTSEVLTLAEVKLHLKVDSTDDDNLIATLITAAQEIAEKRTSRVFISQTLMLTVDNFYDWFYLDNGLPSPWYSYLVVPYPPCTSIVGIQYKDTSGSFQTLSSSIYDPDYVSEPARIYHAYNQSFPLVQQVPSAVKITFVAGYADATKVPASIKCAMKLMISNWYDNRSEISETQMYKVPSSADMLLSMFTIMDI